MKASTLLILLFLLPGVLNAQEEVKDKGNINVHFGTIIVYNTYSIGYESFNLLNNSDQHQLRPVIRMGGWGSSFTSKNKGAQSSLGVTYLFGKGDHLLEHCSEIVFHYDRGLKGQSIVYIGSMYRPYLGYRYQPRNKKIIAKIGLGWKEVIQFGFGYRL